MMVPQTATWARMPTTTSSKPRTPLLLPLLLPQLSLQLPQPSSRRVSTLRSRMMGVCRVSTHPSTSASTWAESGIVFCDTMFEDACNVQAKGQKWCWMHTVREILQRISPCPHA